MSDECTASVDQERAVKGRRRLIVVVLRKGTTDATCSENVTVS